LNPLLGITVLLAAALVGGILAIRLKQPVVLGYLIVGVVAGPYALGIIKDTSVIETAATIGVALLMFTLGLELSFDQLRIGKIGLWGSLIQILVTALGGMLIGWLVLRWTLPQSVFFGLVIYSASTAICLKVLMDRGEINSVHGRIIIAVAIFQDIASVFLILILPFLEQNISSLLPDILTAVAKIMAFIIAALVIGLWVLPWLLGKMGGLKTRELFLLTVLVLAMGTMVATYEFGLPSVFGAFLIGFILRRLRFTEQAIAEITPFRDVFVAIFFVSLGMLLNLTYVFEQWRTLVVLIPAIIMVKLVIVFLITWRFGYGKRVAIMTGAAMYHIGEFGFIIAQSGLTSKIINGEQYSLLIASAIITMLLMPVSMSLAGWISRKSSIRVAQKPPKAVLTVESSEKPTSPVILAGFGRVGSSVAEGLKYAGIDFTVIELDPEGITQLRKKGLPYIYGDCSNGLILAHAGLQKAKTLIITYPDQQSVERTISNALRINPDINIIARAHRLRDINLLRGLGVKELISPEYQASLEFLKRTLTLSGFSNSEIHRLIHSIYPDESLQISEKRTATHNQG
jgi:monovalent cation:H+ antiporter-2, CPA2 family